MCLKGIALHARVRMLTAAEDTTISSPLCCSAYITSVAMGMCCSTVYGTVKVCQPLKASLQNALYADEVFGMFYAASQQTTRDNNLLQRLHTVLRQQSLT